jgi:hypothetical protein
MEQEQLEVERVRREVAKLRAERILTADPVAKSDWASKY